MSQTLTFPAFYYNSLLVQPLFAGRFIRTSNSAFRFTLGAVVRAIVVGVVGVVAVVGAAAAVIVVVVEAAKPSHKYHA